MDVDQIRRIIVAAFAQTNDVVRTHVIDDNRRADAVRRENRRHLKAPDFVQMPGHGHRFVFRTTDNIEATAKNRRFVLIALVLLGRVVAVGFEDDVFTNRQLVGRPLVEIGERTGNRPLTFAAFAARPNVRVHIALRLGECHPHLHQREDFARRIDRRAENSFEPIAKRRHVIAHGGAQRLHGFGEVFGIVGNLIERRRSGFFGRLILVVVRLVFAFFFVGSRVPQAVDIVERLIPRILHLLKTIPLNDRLALDRERAVGNLNCRTVGNFQG